MFYFFIGVSFCYNNITNNQLNAVHDIGNDNKGFKDVSGGLNEYWYDNNGNLTADENKYIDKIEYNLLNFPIKIERNYDDYEILYHYDDSGGNKLKNYHLNITDEYANDYIGNIVYNDNNINYIITTEGRIVKNGSDYTYQYFLKDHLGNTRVVFDENNDIEQVNDYYPFGMRHEPVTQDDLSQKYLYNSKERQDYTAWYDYGARMYDPSIGRWYVQDPLAENFYSLSSYNYAFNNPISYIDPDGRESKIWDWISSLFSSDEEEDEENQNADVWFNMEPIYCFGSYTGSGTTGSWGSVFYTPNYFHFNHESNEEGVELNSFSEQAEAELKEDGNVASSGGGIWSEPGIDISGGLGYKLGLKGQVGIGSYRLGLGLNALDAELGAGISKGYFSHLDIGNVEFTLGRTSASFSVFSTSYNFSENAYSYSLFKPSWDVMNFNVFDRWTIGLKLQGGPFRGNISINPVRTGAQGVMMINSYAKYKTGQAPPTPMFSIIDLLFGD